ncbi:hypothetical protein [Rickettsia bellii]|uniref:Uncharacterized protein n=2 Tax=Rickettsia bellii TaxID=33990 RepID=Q1RHU7_RICBR|nr:hypothetical protein [Rickettsia bellii]ABE05067.1 unknown [Rickettsia bellii RML369-C]ABV79098.1 hypothetical protein A1I_03725 [Rickettsia bellii OSU 85-389]KJV91880.1 hypothetical protein RBEMOGI_0492 [Rickettsia bellii str. RML Mogi]
MLRIEKAEDAWLFKGAIVAFKPKSFYYGKNRDNIFNNEFVFGLLGDRFFPHIMGGKYLCLYLFQIGKTTNENIYLNSDKLELNEAGYLDMRFANLKEIKTLRHLVDFNYIILNSFNKTYTIYMLNNILTYDPDINLLDINYNKDTLAITLDWHNYKEKENTKILGFVDISN